MEYSIDQMHRDFCEQAGAVLYDTSTCNVPFEESPLTIETIQKAMKSLPPEPYPSPIPTRFEYAPYLPRRLGLIFANGDSIPVGTVVWTSPDTLEITVVSRARMTYVRCGGDVYDVIQKKLFESGLPLSGQTIKIVNN